jgi:hypothetical protein
MAKAPTKSVPAVTHAAGMAARAVARLEANAAAVHAGAMEKPGYQAGARISFL